MAGGSSLFKHVAILAFLFFISAFSFKKFALKKNVNDDNNSTKNKGKEVKTVNVQEKKSIEVQTTTESVEESYIRSTWSKIAGAVLPPTVVTPYLKVKYSEFHDCLMETQFTPRLGEIIEKTEKYSNGKFNLEITSELIIEQPMFFNYIVKYFEKGKSNTEARFCLPFIKKNVVKFKMEVMDYSKNQERINEQCSVIINSLAVVKMDDPVFDNCEDKEETLVEMTKSYWSHVNDASSFLAIMSDALGRGVREQVGKQENLWICLSTGFSEKLIERRGAKYKKDYKEFCNGEPIKK